MKEYPKSMTDEMLRVTDLEAVFPDGEARMVAGASSYVMFLSESDHTMIKIFFDVDTMNKTFDIVKYATTTTVSFMMRAESGLYMEFDAIAVDVGRNCVTLRVKRKSIADFF